jgi:hypothetical protein
MTTCASSHGPYFFRASASASILVHLSFINVPHTTSKFKKTIFSHLRIKSNSWSATDMDDQDLSVLYPLLSHEQYADCYTYRYIHLKGIYVPKVVIKKTHYSHVDISVDFFKKRPTSDLKLVFKDGAGVKQQSSKFKKNDPIYWNLDMSVHAVFTITLHY